ncbi:MAG: DUF327 family protein [Brevinema sp.]
MKIIPSAPQKKSLTNSSKKESVKAKSGSFMKMIDDNSEEEMIIASIFSDPDTVLNNLSLLAEEVDRLGEELSEKPLPENFNKYKKHIKLLLKSVTKNVEIQEITARVGITRTKLYRTAQAIDQALADLAEKILFDEKNRMDILKLTGHLKGLILDLLA